MDNVIHPYQFQMNQREKVCCPLTTLTSSELMTITLKLMDSKKFMREHREIIAKLDAAIEEDYAVKAKATT